MVASSAGSGTDLLARELAQRMAVELKQPVVVDNKPGGSGVIGTQAVVRAAADGYTLLYTTGSNTVMAPALMKNLPYDVTKDLVPVAQTVEGGVILHVSNDLPVTSLPELVKLVKANPGKYSYGTWAVGSSGHLTMEWLKRKTGMDLPHVPYRQTNQLLTELTTGTLKIGFTDPGAPLPFIESRRLRSIAVTGVVRLPRTPDIPTFREQGFDFEPVGWFGVLAPARTPAAIVERLGALITRIQNQPDMVKKVAALNVQPAQAKTPAQFQAIIQRDLQMWKQIVTDTGITLDN
ncbi:tripartite tricarboxylate transporter substrate binding protein [Comamonas humi]